MSRVFWDSNLFVYLLEDYKTLSEITATISERMLARNDQLFSSTLALGEVLVKPLELGNQSLVNRIEEIMSRRVGLVPFDQKAARIYAQIRRDRSIKAPDAIQLACAASEGMDLFITNDNHLAGKVVPGVGFMTSMQDAVRLLGG